MTVAAPQQIHGQYDSEAKRATETHSLTDTGNAERLTGLAAGNFRYCHERRLWVVCDQSGRWNWDRGGHLINHLGKKTVQSIYSEAERETSEAHRKALAKHALASEALHRRHALIELAKSEQSIPITLDKFDRDSWLFAVRNGVIDLHTGSLRPLNREDFITKTSGVNFNAYATCPTWWEFLRRIFADDRELISYVQQAVGYTLTGLTVEQVFFLLHGAGANGKSTFMRVLLELFGDYGLHCPADTFLARAQDGRAAPDLVRLQGVRLAAAIESDAGARLAQSMIKAMTGGDAITARGLYQDYTQFIPTHTVWFATNHKPRVTDATHAMWRRVRMIPYPVQIPCTEQDPTLSDRLIAELPGILNWAIAGCLEWQRAGRLIAPRAVLESTQTYRDEQDVLDDFVREHCIRDRTASVPFGELHKAYVAWAGETMERPISSRAFANALQERGFHPTTEKRARHYRGLRLRTPRDSDATGTVDADVEEVLDAD
jgi:putative DNA primase/helicase